VLEWWSIGVLGLRSGSLVTRRKFVVRVRKTSTITYHEHDSGAKRLNGLNRLNQKGI
jgi:hypothetical protein